MQIRAQLAAEGHPLLGDTMYEPLACSSTRASQGTQEVDDQGSQHAEEVQVDSMDSLGRIQGSTDEPFDCSPVEDKRTGCDTGIGATEGLAEEEELIVHRSVRLLNEPLASGIGLQACRLEVHAPNNLMGPSPAVFEASVPWWREPFSP